MERVKLLLVYLFIGVITHAQLKISGKVLDEKTNQPISFADIYIPELELEVYANDDGSFYLESDENATEVEVSFFGYETKIIQLEKKVNYDFIVTLTLEETDEENVNLNEVVVSNKKIKYKNKKENPAWAILRELWRRKRKNGLRAVPQYEYEEYEKIEFDLNNIDSSFINRKIFKGFEFVFERLDTSKVTGKTYLPAFLNESIYRIYGKNDPRKERRDLIANKASGFEDNEIVIETVKNLYKEYDIYQSRINFFDKNFVSPVARDGFSTYDYVLSDTVDIDGVECFRIKYYPKRKNELTFKGDMYVSNGTFAIKEITLESTTGINVNFVRDVFVELEYDVLNDSVFLPKRTYTLMDLSLISKKDKAKGMFAHRTNSFKNYNFEKPLEDDFYSERYDPHRADAYKKSNEFWAESRHEQLTNDEEGIYETLELLKNNQKFRRIVNAIEIIGSGYYNVWNSIDIGNLYSTFGFNDIEGLRVRAGARTYFSKNDMWRLAGYTAYGFRDNVFKYGVEGRYMFNSYNRFQLGFGTKRDVEQLGAQLTTSDGILSRSFASSTLLNNGANNLLSSLNKTNFYTSIDPWENFTIRADVSYKTIRSADPSVFNVNYIKDGIEQSNLIDFTTSASLIYRPKAKYSQYGIDRFEHSSLTPTFLLRFTKGYEGVFNSEFNYDRIQFYYEQPILIGSYGRSNVTFQFGKTFDPLPISLLSVIPGNESFGYQPGVFNQMDFYEFVTDTYSTLIIDHHFNGWIMSKIPILKKTKMRTVGFIRSAWGEISEESVAINRSDITYLAPEDEIYFEYGFGIENIGFGNIRPLRILFNWRGNYKTEETRNFGVSIGFDFSF